jgi:hypothetical protein
MQQIARFFSYVFHPVFIPVYMLLFVYGSDPYLQYIIPISRLKPLLWLLVINTIIMPLLTFFYLKSRGIITSLFLEKSEERKIAIIILFLFHLVTYILWRKLELPTSFLSLFFGILISLIFAYFISGYLKISLHTMAFGGVVGAILGLYRAHGFIDYSILATTIIGLGIIASARLLLNAHSPREINYGALCGFIILYITSGFNLFL